MQRYSGILMGRRKKPSNETEAKMEGSRDDHEALDLTLVVVEFNKFQQSVNHVERTLVRYLDEYHETNKKAQTEISETLKKVDENLQIMNMNQSKLTAFLMEMAHKGKDPDTYGHKEAGGSGGIHEEIRHNQEKASISEGVWKETRSRVKWVAGSIRGDTYPDSEMNILANI
jgi:hypothetical protein